MNLSHFQYFYRQKPSFVEFDLFQDTEKTNSKSITFLLIQSWRLLMTIRWNFKPENIQLLSEILHEILQSFAFTENNRENSVVGT